MYNGGVSYKGDKQLAEQAMPEALKLANMVSALKESAGLERLEKVYDIDGGTVRVVDFEHVRHLYIDVSQPVEPEPEIIEDIEALEASTYAAFPAHNAEWTHPARPGDAAAALTPNTTAEGTTSLTLAGEDLLEDVYEYNSFFSDRYAWSYLHWTGLNNLTLYTRVKTMTNRYSMSYGDRAYDGYLLWRGRLMFVLPAKWQYMGFGIMGNKLIILSTLFTDFTGEAIPTFAGGTVTVQSMDVAFNSETGRLTTSSGTLVTVGTFEQGRTDYGLAEDGGFYKPAYQQAQKDLWYDLPYNPEMSYNPQFGSLWFNFAPDGSKAVRCRYFAETPDVSSETVNNMTWKEELAFSLDGNGDVQFTRTKTANGTGCVYSGAIVVNTYASAEEPPYPGCPGLEDDRPADGTECDFSSFSTHNYQYDSSISSVETPIAYDYDTNGDLVEMFIQFTEATSSYQSYDHYESAGHTDYTYDYYNPGVGEEWKSYTNATGFTSRSSATSMRVRAHLRIGTTQIPYYNADLVSSSSYSQDDISYTERVYHGGGFDEAVLEYWKTSDITQAQNGTLTDNFWTLRGVCNGVSDMDLRYGWIVISDTPSSSTWAYSGSYFSHSDNPVLNWVIPGQTNYSAERNDTLHIVRDGNHTTAPLNPVTGNPAIKYSISDNTAAGSGETVWYTPRQYPRSGDGGDYVLQLVAGCAGIAGELYDTYRSSSNYFDYAYPTKNSLWAAGVVRGMGGSLAINPHSGTPHGVFSVISSDFNWDRSGTGDFIEDFMDYRQGTYSVDCAQVNRFPLCQQAVYYYDGTAGVATNLTDAMWGAEEYNGLLFRNKDTGITHAFTHFESYGLVSHIEYVDAEVDL